MCGRYAILTDDENDEILKILEQIQKQEYHSSVQSGEIYPTNHAPVLLSRDEKLAPEVQIWGFPNFKNKGVIINARSETVMEKHLFRQSVFTKRCVIPSTGFYEWKHDETRKKYLFRMNGKTPLYMAGLYNEFNGEKRFVVLTTKANDSIADVHNRMPVVINNDLIADWIFDTNRAIAMLNDVPPALVRMEA